MIKKLLMLALKAGPLAPIFAVISIFRKIKNAIMKLIGGSKKAAGAAASATSTAKNVAEQHSSGEADQAGTEQHSSAESAEPSATQATPTESTETAANAESMARGGNPRLAAFLVGLGVFQLVGAHLDGVMQSLYSTFSSAWVFVLRPIFDIPIWLGLVSGGSTYFTISGWVYGIAFLGLGAAAYNEVSTTVETRTKQFLGANIASFWLLTLLWDSYSLTEFLFGSVLYTALMAAGIGLLVTDFPETGTVPSTTQPTSTTTSTASSESADTNPTTAMSNSASSSMTESNNQPSDTTTQQAAASTESAPDETDTEPTPAATDSERSQDGPTEATEDADSKPATDETADVETMSTADDRRDVDAASSEEKKAPSPAVESAIDQLEAATPPGSELPSLSDFSWDGDSSKETMRALERYVDADDPEVRLAVCELCAVLETEYADEILKTCRIDPDTQVARAAIDGLSD